MKDQGEASTEPYQPKYPSSAKLLKAGERMAHLDPAARDGIAEDTRYFRNALARSMGAALSDPFATDEDARRAPFKFANRKANRLLEHWFREDPHGVGPNTYLPHIGMAEHALTKVTTAPIGDEVASRFPNMRDERMRGYGIREDFFPADDRAATNDRLHLLAWMMGIPPGYLLLQLHVHEIPVKRSGQPATWVEAPLHDWLRTRIAVALGKLGVEPLAIEATPGSPFRETLEDARAIHLWLRNEAAIALDDLGVPPLAELVGPVLGPVHLAHVVGRFAPAACRGPQEVTIKPEIEAALEAVTTIKAIQHQLGSPQDFFQVLGGPRVFEARFGFHDSRRLGMTLRTPNFPYATMRKYLHTDYRRMSPAQLNRGAHLPAPTNIRRISELVELLQPLLPEHGARCTPAQRRSITAAVAFEAKRQADTVADLMGTSPATAAALAS